MLVEAGVYQRADAVGHGIAKVAFEVDGFQLDGAAGFEVAAVRGE